MTIIHVWNVFFLVSIIVTNNNQLNLYNHCVRANTSIYNVIMFLIIANIAQLLPPPPPSLCLNVHLHSFIYIYKFLVHVVNILIVSNCTFLCYCFFLNRKIWLCFWYQLSPFKLLVGYAWDCFILDVNISYD